MTVASVVNTWKSRTVNAALIAMFLSPMVLEGASVDEIVMKDGSRVFGTIISVDESSVKYDGGLSLPVRISRDEVELIIFGRITIRRKNPSPTDAVDAFVDSPDEPDGTLQRTSNHTAVLLPFKGTVGRSPLP